MLANILLVVFLIAMAYWWGLQGFFSAFLHLIVTIVAAAIAFAVWEPFVMGFLFHRMPEYAWGVGLLGPFILAMIVLRLPLDYLVGKNVHFHQIANLAAGGLCGVLSGILISGLTVIGLSYLPMGISLGGYQPVGIEPSGRTTDTGQRLWVPVDHHAAAYFTKLSGGTFNAGHPMARYRPDVADQAAQFRLQRHYDPNASLVATPPSVSVTQMAIHKAPLPNVDAATLNGLGPAAKQASNKIVAVETLWQASPGVFDQGTLYLSPVQMKLATRQGRSGDEQVKLHEPVAFSRTLATGRTEMSPITSDRLSANSSDQRQSITWTFVVPAEAEPAYLFARQLRLPLPEPVVEPGKLAALLGTPVVVQQVDPAAVDPSATVAEGEIGGREGPRTGSMPVAIEATDRLPNTVSLNYTQGLTIQDGAVVAGRKDVSRSTGGIAANLRVDRIWRPSHQRVVRARIARDQAYTIYGQSVAAAASLQQPAIEDNQGQFWNAIGYVWEKADGTQQISINRDTLVRTARELPIGQMGADDGLYLYFVVNANTRIVKFWYGHGGQRDTGFECDVPVD
jgi:hypothetical protein